MIRRMLPVAAVLVTVAAASTALAGGCPESYEAALAHAVETGKPVVLDFFTEW